MCGLKGTQEHLDYVVCVHTLTVGWGREGVVVVVGVGVGVVVVVVVGMGR